MCAQRKAMWRHSKEMTIGKPRTEASEESKPADTLVSDFWPPELWEDKFLLLRPPHLWYFIVAALGNEWNSLQTFLPFSLLPALPLKEWWEEPRLFRHKGCLPFPQDSSASSSYIFHHEEEPFSGSRWLPASPSQGRSGNFFHYNVSLP